MKKTVALILVLSLAFTLFSCDNDSGSVDETTTEDYVLPTPVVNADISLPYTSAADFDPFTTQSTLNRDLICVIFESLYVSESSGLGSPLLASSGENNEKTVTVKLKQGVKFSDGTELTAKYVKSSFELAKKSDYYKSELSNVASVKATDNFTLVFTLYNRDDMTLNVLNFPIVKSAGNGYIGTGKYYMDYLDETPFLQANSNHREYKDTWNLQIALYDMAGVSSPVYPFKANKISAYKNNLSSEEYVNLSSQTLSAELNNLVYVGVNSQWSGSITSMDWVRQAINIGIDRNAITASSFLGQGTATVTPFKSDFYKLKDIELVGTGGDIEKAIGILERHGYTQFNGDGVRTDGVTALKVNIIVCTENPYKLTVAENFKKELEKLGLGVSIKEYKSSEEFLLVLEEGHYSFYIGETQMTSNCDMTEFFSPEGTLNYGISEDMYEDFNLYKSGESSATLFVENFSTKVPFLPLFYRKAIVSVNPNISGLESINGLYSSVCDWKTDKS